MSKYKAKKTEYDGMTFDSKKECQYYKQLKEMQNNGEISNLQCQVKYSLIPKQRTPYGETFREIAYIADFVYTDSKSKEHIVDVKGCKIGVAYSMFMIKRKLMWYIHKKFVEVV